MKLVALLLSFALILPGTVSEFCFGGKLPCVTDASCAGSDRCECDSGFYGNGRVKCVNSTTRCVCTALADPEFQQVDPKDDPKTFKVNIPCSVALASNLQRSGCLVNKIIAHPDPRGTGNAANLRVFVGELELKTNFPSVSLTINDGGVNVMSGAASVDQGSQDGYSTAAVTGTCQDALSIGFNDTYGGAYVEYDEGFVVGSGSAGICGECDDTGDASITADNATHLVQFIKNVVETAEQKGPYEDECGQLALLSSCDDAKLTTAMTVCGRYVSSYGVCLLDEAGSTDFGLRLTDFRTCAFNICFIDADASTQCTALFGTETAGCKVGDVDGC